MDNKPVAIDDLKDVLDIVESFANFIKKHPFGVTLAVLGLLLDTHFNVGVEGVSSNLLYAE